MPSTATGYLPWHCFGSEAFAQRCRYRLWGTPVGPLILWARIFALIFWRSRTGCRYLVDHLRQGWGFGWRPSLGWWRGSRWLGLGGRRCFHLSYDLQLEASNSTLPIRSCLRKPWDRIGCGTIARVVVTWCYRGGVRSRRRVNARGICGANGDYLEFPPVWKAQCFYCWFERDLRCFLRLIWRVA